MPATRVVPPRSRHLLYGFPYQHSAKHATDVQATWRRYGWKPRSECTDVDTSHTYEHDGRPMALPSPEQKPRTMGFI